MHRIPTIELMTSRRRKLLFSRSSRFKRLPPSLTSFRLYAKMQAKGGVKMQFPNFHEFEPYLRSIEHEVGQNASKLVIYQLEDKTPESVSAFASDVAGQTLAVANKMAIAYLAAYHQFLSDYFENRESD
jgi:hypothetical protein